MRDDDSNNLIEEIINDINKINNLKNFIKNKSYDLIETIIKNNKENCSYKSFINSTIDFSLVKGKNDIKFNNKKITRMIMLLTI